MDVRNSSKQKTKHPYLYIQPCVHIDRETLLDRVNARNSSKQPSIVLHAVNVCVCV